MSMHLNHRFSAIILGLILAYFTFQYANAQTEISARESVSSYLVRSDVLQEDREISLYVPASYEIGSEQYPVLVILDGEDFLQPFAGMVEYYSKIGRCPELIVVGVHSRDRWRDYTPTHASIPDGTLLPSSGGAGVFHQFINDELMPFIESRYRTTAFHVLYGHSIAGLFVISSYFDELSRFSGYIATSPSLWWDKELMTRNAQNASRLRNCKSRYLFFTIGNEDSTMLGPVLRFNGALEKQTGINAHWTFERFDNIDHQTMPIKSFSYGLEYIFDDWQMPQHLYQEGLQAIVDYYDTLSAKYLQKIVPPESIVNRLGYMELRQGNCEQALRIFLVNVETYPRSANAYDSLGEAFMKAGDSANAIINYEKSLELNPDNTNAKNMLQKLKNGE